MADRKKVFDAIRNCVTEPKCRDCPWEECERFECKKVSVPANLLLDALKLLKEQEAVEPINSYGTFRCGNCRNIVGYNDGYGRGYQNNFCSKCGKAVKWK